MLNSTFFTFSGVSELKSEALAYEHCRSCISSSQKALSFFRFFHSYDTIVANAFAEDTGIANVSCPFGIRTVNVLPMSAQISRFAVVRSIDLLLSDREEDSRYLSKLYGMLRGGFLALYADDEYKAQARVLSTKMHRHCFDEDVPWARSSTEYGFSFARASILSGLSQEDGLAAYRIGYKFGKLVYLYDDLKDVSEDFSSGQENWINQKRAKGSSFREALEELTRELRNDAAYVRRRFLAGHLKSRARARELVLSAYSECISRVEMLANETGLEYRQSPIEKIKSAFIGGATFLSVDDLLDQRFGRVAGDDCLPDCNPGECVFCFCPR